VNPVFSERSTRFTLTVMSLAAATVLGGCSSIEGLFGGDKVDYRNTAAKPQNLEVPPDLTQLARDSRYQPQGGVVSASGAAAAVPAGAPGATPSATTVALSNVGDIKVERAGQQRWLVVAQTPEQLWPQLKAFWERRGFTLAIENQQTGVMETNWAENRSKLPADVIRSTIGKLFGNLYDTGERDLYRTRVERTATGSEIYISHRGLEEVYTSERKESTAWRGRPGDPQLEAEFLSGLMVALGNKEEPARAAVANAPQQPVKASVAAGGQATSLVVEEPFDRAWRRVGLALDRGGFTVEDRDRAGGLYYVRYVDPKNAGKDEPSWWSKLFGDGSNPQAALRYRILLKAAGDKTNLSVQTSTGAPDTGENAKRIVGLLINDLK
jgi:outer membrane protein assembly factor BamC